MRGSQFLNAVNVLQSEPDSTTQTVVVVSTD